MPPLRINLVYEQIVLTLLLFFFFWVVMTVLMYRSTFTVLSIIYRIKQLQNVIYVCLFGFKRQTFSNVLLFLLICLAVCVLHYSYFMIVLVILLVGLFFTFLSVRSLISLCLYNCLIVFYFMCMIMYIMSKFTFFVIYKKKTTQCAIV